MRRSDEHSRGKGGAVGGREKSMCKGPELEDRLVCLRTIKAANMTQKGRKRKERDKENFQAFVEHFEKFLFFFLMKQEATFGTGI